MEKVGCRVTQGQLLTTPGQKQGEQTQGPAPTAAPRCRLYECRQRQGADTLHLGWDEERAHAHALFTHGAARQSLSKGSLGHSLTQFKQPPT